MDKEPHNLLPPGVTLLRTIDAHQGTIKSIAFDPQGITLAAGGWDGMIKLWEAQSDKLLLTLEGHKGMVLSVAFDPKGVTLASGGNDGTIKLWELQSGKLLRTLEAQQGKIISVAFDPQGLTLVSGGMDATVTLWDTQSGKILHTFDGNNGWINSVAFDPQGIRLASGSQNGTLMFWKERQLERIIFSTLEGYNGCINSVAFDLEGIKLASGGSQGTVKLWEPHSGKLLRTLEGHTGAVEIVAFSPDGRLLASKSNDETIRLWSCASWECVAVIPVRKGKYSIWIPALAFHPDSSLLATVGSLDTSRKKKDHLIHLFELDYDLLLGKSAGLVASSRAVHHTTGKIMLLGDHSVGKSALGHYLIHNTFKEQASTHGQQFWIFPALGHRRSDGTECEAILWDFAGQPDYRLVHALFVDNADLALVLFDASDLRDPLHGVEFWLNQLQSEQSNCPIILVAAQTDRGSCSLTPDELKAFCQEHGIVGPISTSAFTGEGIAELLEQMKVLIPWDEKPATVTTTTFKRIKDYVLGLKESDSEKLLIVTPVELRRRLEATDGTWHFTDAEMLTAVSHLENYGYVKRLRTSKGEERILLQPERLNNLASSFVLEARRNVKGLGALEESRLLSGGYDFPELRELHDGDRDVLLDAAALLFLEHNVCFRETDPLRMEPYLVFPELINLKKPSEKEAPTEDSVAYTVNGPMENVFASLVVLLGYTHTFTRTNQWHNNARYEVGNGLVCGFRQETGQDGELDFVLCFGAQVGTPVRTLFQGMFESFLSRRNLTVLRHEPVQCSKGHPMNRTIIREAMQDGDEYAFCRKCGERLLLPKMEEPIQLTRDVQADVELQRRAAEKRTRFEQAVFRIQAYVTEQNITPPECFISYAWGVPEQERWVEKRLATDLLKAGIVVVLDRWHNAQIGASVSRFVERIEKSDRIVMVGTPLYRRKYENKVSTSGSVVAAEVDMIANRLLGTEAQKESVLPVLLDGEKTASLPPLLHGRVYADFRNDSAYFTTVFDLILTIYQLPPNHPAVADLRESLNGLEMR